MAPRFTQDHAETRVQAMVDQQRSAPAFVEVKALVQNFASDFFAGGVASGFTKSAMAPVER